MPSEIHLADPKRPFVPYVGDGQRITCPQDSKEWNSYVMKHPEGRRGNCLFLPLVPYSDTIQLSRNGKIGLTPWFLTSPMFRRKHRTTFDTQQLWFLCPDQKLTDDKDENGKAKLKGVNIREKHRILRYMMRDLEDACRRLETHRWKVRIGGQTRVLPIYARLLYISGDMEMNNMLCGMYNTSGYHQNRRCDIHLSLCNDPFVSCRKINTNLIKRDTSIVMNDMKEKDIKVESNITGPAKEALLRLRESSFYCVENAFWKIPWAGRRSCINHNTPTDYLHALMLGVCKYAATEITRIIPSIAKKKIDKAASRRLRRIHNGVSVPRLNFCGGFFNMAKLNGQEIISLLWGILAMMQSD